MAPEMEQKDPKMLKELLENRSYRNLRAEFEDMNEVDIAHFIGGLPTDKALIAFRTLPKDAEMDVFAELDAETQQHIIQSISDEEIGEILDELMVDDAVDLLGELPAKLVPQIIRTSSPQTRQMINQFLLYPKDSAGSIMTAEFTGLKRGMTVDDAIKRIRRTGEDKETIYTCYVMDDTRHLEGVITVKDLLLAQDGDLVGDIMEPAVISVATADHQADAAQLMAKYGLIALPVVDAENRLVGIVTVDDAVDVILEEDTEDFERMAAMVPSEKPYLKTSVFTLAKNRLPWLLILMVSGMLTGGLLGHYQDIYLAIPVLVTFITMLNGTGGNSGSQSSTMVIRGMALGEIQLKDVGVVAFKEARVAMLVGLGLGLVNFARMMLLTNRGDAMLALVVSLSLMCAVFVAKLIGGVLPMLAKRLKLDPALMAAPLITTIVDAVVLVIYFNIARFILL